MSPRTKRSTALTASAADCAGAVPPARRAALRTARFERRTMPDIWIDPPNSGLRFGGSFCMRKQCACLRGGIGGGAVGRSGRGWTCGSVAGFCARFTPAVCSSVGAVCARCALGVRSLFVRPCRPCVFVCHVGMRSWSARRCGSVVAFCLGLRLSFFLCQEKRDGLQDAAFLFRAGRDRHSCVLAVLARLSGLVETRI